MFCFIHLIICLLCKLLNMHLYIFINNSHTFVHYTYLYTTHIAYNFKHNFYNIFSFTTKNKISLCKKYLKINFPSPKHIRLILLPFLPKSIIKPFLLLFLYISIYCNLLLNSDKIILFLFACTCSRVNEDKIYLYFYIMHPVTNYILNNE